MNASHLKGKIHFEKPGKYRIVVQGRLDESWSDRLSGMRITPVDTKHAEMTTNFIGELRDQTQLSGILTCLHDLHLPILSVEWLGNENTD